MSATAKEPGRGQADESAADHQYLHSPLDLIRPPNILELTGTCNAIVPTPARHASPTGKIGMHRMLEPRHIALARSSGPPLHVESYDNDSPTACLLIHGGGDGA